ncbi:hypothetical protein [Kitasatospora cineracea]|uniref:hypothetical protein n=1 Tax=Kitasatospora cineracea TaxID=88074 RepID=UPI0036A415A5
MLSTAAVVKGLPHHFKQTSDLPKLLTEGEREALARAEAAVEMLELSYWAAGKALQIIRDGRLYRATHDTFELYLEARWGMKRANANKLIKAWPVAQAVFENKSNTLAHAGAKALLAFRSALELVPAAEKHGIEAATEVWGMVLEVAPKPTSDMVRQAVKAVPAQQPFDAKRVRPAVQAAVKPAKAAAPRPRRAPQAPAPAAAPAVPWDDPQALYGLLCEHMTPEGRAGLLELLRQESVAPV